MSRRGWLLFAAVSVIWGIPYLLIKIALQGMSAPCLVLTRTAVGAAFLLPVALRRGVLRAALRRWPAVLAFAALEMAGPWLLLGDAEGHMSSSLAGLLVSGVPLFVSIIMWRLGDHSAVSWLRVLGLISGMSGVAAVVGFTVGTVSWVRMGEVLAVSIGYAVAPVLAYRKLAGVPTLGVIAVSLTCVVLVYLPVVSLGHPDLRPRISAWGAAALLGILCTAVVFLLSFALINEVGPAKASMNTFVNPIVAILAGVLLLHEPFGIGMFVGTILVLAGISLSICRRW